MSRWDAYGKADSQVRLDGDPGFTGIDMVRDRATLAPGILARSENKRLRNKIAETRPGTSLASDFNPAFESEINGSGVYSNPNGPEQLMVSTKNQTYVWALQYDKDPVKIFIHQPGGPSPPADTTGTTGDNLVHFCQAFDHLFLMRSIEPAPFSILVWDGDMTHKFERIELSEVGSSLIPNYPLGIPFANRILLYAPFIRLPPLNDQFLMTDILDYTSYDKLLSVFRVNAGASEMLTALYPYDQARVLVFMEHSVHLVSEFTIDQFLMKQEVLSSRVGNAGAYSVTQLGGDIIFLSQPGGIYRVSQSASAQIAADPVAISEPIQPVIDRIAWSRVWIKSSMAALKDYLYVALPLDNPSDTTTAANAIVVYNGNTRQWESAPDTWDNPHFAINRLHVTLYNSEQRVFAIDYVAKRVYLLYDGINDDIGQLERVPVRDVIETRGYLCGDPSGFKNFSRAIIGLRVAAPLATVTALTDGVNEEKEIAQITKSSLKSYVHGKANGVPEDSREPYREDYPFGEVEIAVEAFENLPDGNVAFLPETQGLILTGDKQQSLERFQIRDSGRWVSVRIENVRGQCDVLGVGVEGVTTEEGVKVLV